MITKNYKALLAMALTATNMTSSSSSVRLGGTQGKDLTGTTYYFTNYFREGSGVFPYSADYNVSFATDYSGIAIGTGGTPATEDDYTLESMITSGVSASTASIAVGFEGGSAPYIEYTVTVTNTGSAPVTIREIGLRQRAVASTAQGAGQTGSGKFFLLDRTVLDTPLTIPAGQSGVIAYKLMTSVS